jgi:hypothetical protein
MEITGDSHLDHGLLTSHIDYLLWQFGDRSEFFVETLELPAELISLKCGLHGPATGGDPVPEDEVFYEKRGDRPGESRLCRRDLIETRKVTVVAGPHDGKPCVLFTAYGGPCAPREPWDDSLTADQKAESEKFWHEHALSAD